MSRYITLDQPMIDYLTVTSYEVEELYRVALQGIQAVDERAETKDGVRHLNYTGFTSTLVCGNVFYGEGVQKGMPHAMLRLSGEVADSTEFLHRILSLYRMSMANVSRIDFQVSVEQPKGWTQWGLFNRLKKAGRSTGWHESTTKDGVNLATVYSGQRTSGKFGRYYQKELDKGGLVMRFEWELKGNYAKSYFQQIAKGHATVRQLTQLLVDQCGDDKTKSLLLPIVGKPETGKVKILVPEKNIERWITETVIPAMRRYVNSHNADPLLIKQWRDATRCWLDDESG